MKSRKILFLTPYPFDTAPSQRLRFEAFLPYFKTNGYAIIQRSFVSLSFWKIIYTKGNYFRKTAYTFLGYVNLLFTLLTIRRYDIIYIHLWVAPFGPPIFEWLFKKMARKTIYDIDDMLYVGDTSRFNKLVSVLKSNRNALYLLKHADHVIVSTDMNYSKASELNRNVTNIPVCVDTEKYFPQKRKKEKIVVGWTGSKSTSKYLKVLDPIFKRLVCDNRIEILVIGDEGYSVEGIKIRSIPWNADTEVRDINEIDIGIYPLPDELWVLGKGGGKALQYMSLMIPVVGTAIGESNKIVDDSVNGYLIPVLDSEDWFKKIMNLVEDETLRVKLGENGRKKVAEEYSLKRNFHKYIAVFNELS